MVTVIFLGKLGDLAGAPEREIAAPLDWNGLLDALSEPLASATRDEKTRIALNGEVLADKAALFAGDGDEIALLPPVSGG